MKLDIVYVQAQLRRRVSERQLVLVIQGCGVKLRTVRRIMDGESAKVQTVEALQEYLKKTERLAFLPDTRKNGAA